MKGPMLSLSNRTTMKYTAIMLLVASITITCSLSAMDGAPRLQTREICFNSNCNTYGCKGQYGACAGICYCYGSGYEYRCGFCDIFG